MGARDDSWPERAACKDYHDPDVFFRWETLNATRGPERDSMIAEARAICDACPVKQECLEQALEARERWGMWGGTTAQERKEMFKEAQRRAVPISRGVKMGRKGNQLRLVDAS